MSDADRNADVERLMTDNLPRLRAFIRARTNAAIRARESCSDLVQSVCRELVEGADRCQFESEAAFRGWLFTAALRKIIERNRRMGAGKRDAARELPFDEARDASLLDAYGTVSTPSAVLGRQEQLASLEAALDELGEEQREVLSLARFGGLSYAEIAAATGRSEEACRQVMRRALIRLRLALDRRGVDLTDG